MKCDKQKQINYNYHMTPFRIKPSVVAILVSEHVLLSDEGPLLKTLEFLSTSHDSNQLLNFLR